MLEPHLDTSDKLPTPNAWISEPPFVLFRFLRNEAAVAGLARSAVMITEFAPWLFKAASKGVRSSDKAVVSALKQLAEQSQEPSGFAAEELKSGFQTLSAHSAIALWAGIETAIEQCLLNHIQALPNAKSIIVAHAPLLKADKLKVGSDAEARRSLKSWENALDSNDTVQRALTMLAAFGLAIRLEPGERQLLSEMAEVRNILLHRGSFVDDRFVTKCPWLDLKPGEKLIVDEQKLASFTQAATAFASAFAAAAISSPYLFEQLSDPT